jgi:hypothetical protein
VRIAPLPGNSPKIVCRAPHPDGFISLNLEFKADRCRGTVELPLQITGVFVWHGHEMTLNGGLNNIDITQ